MIPNPLRHGLEKVVEHILGGEVIFLTRAGDFAVELHHLVHRTLGRVHDVGEHGHERGTRRFLLSRRGVPGRFTLHRGHGRFGASGDLFEVTLHHLAGGRVSGEGEDGIRTRPVFGVEGVSIDEQEIGLGKLGVKTFQLRNHLRAVTTPGREDDHHQIGRRIDDFLDLGLVGLFGLRIVDHDGRRHGGGGLAFALHSLCDHGHDPLARRAQSRVVGMALLLRVGHEEDRDGSDTDEHTHGGTFGAGARRLVRTVHQGVETKDVVHGKWREIGCDVLL